MKSYKKNISNLFFLGKYLIINHLPIKYAAFEIKLQGKL